MWKLWIIFSVFKFSFSAPVDSKDGSVTSKDAVGLRCLLFPTQVISNCEDFKGYGDHIPKRLQKLYDKVKKPFTEIGHEEILNTNTMDLIPTTLLYLIPRTRLVNITGHIAGKLLRNTPSDEALAIKLASLLQHDSDKQAFLQSLLLKGDDDEETGVYLPSGVQEELGRAMAIWYPRGHDWQYWQYDVSLMAGTPVLAHLPSHFINRISHQIAEKFLFHLKNWPADDEAVATWTRHPAHIKRIWTHTALTKWDQPHLWFPGVVRVGGHLLLGATPDEIEEITSYAQDKSQVFALLKLDFAPLQSRALFDIVNSNYTESESLKSMKKQLTNLLPRQLQQYDAATTDIVSQLPAGFKSGLPTGKQILQHHVAHLVATKKLKNLAPSKWENELSLLGKMVHLLPASSLENLQNKQLSLETMEKISSPSLSFRQTRYLSNNGEPSVADELEFLSQATHYLKALPAHSISDILNGDFPDTLRIQFLKNVPTLNKALTAMVIEKVHLDISDRSLLSAIFANDDYQGILSVLSAHDVKKQFLRITESLDSIAMENDHMSWKVRNLPSNIGTNLLAEFRKADLEDGWTLDNMVLTPKHPVLRYLISHLQCADIDLINDADVVPILGYYVRERRALGLAFPKNMQYCCQKALTRYLELKSSLRQIHGQDYGLLNLLELFEVKAVGGYILSSLPLDVIDSSLLKHQIIREIGSLTLPELLTATSITNLRMLANNYGGNSKELHLREMTELGNLIWFLDANHIRRLNGSHFKLLLEMMEQSSTKASCLTSEERDVWREFIVTVFGKPNSWSAGTLTVLGDLLFLFEDVDLDMIVASARIEAADLLSNYTSFHQLVEWPGKLEPISYFEACMEALPEAERHMYKTSVRSLVRFYLESSQMLLDTVIPADALLRLDDISNTIDDEESTSEISLTTENQVDTKKEIVKRSVDDKARKKWRKMFRGTKNEPEVTEEKKKELLANGSRALVMVFETKIDQNNTKVTISETFPRSLEISCDAIRMLRGSASLVLDEDHFKNWSDNDLEDCSEVLGSLNLTVNVRKSIWRRLKKWRESGNLLEVGNLVSVIEKEDIDKLQLDLTKPWALETLSVLSQHLTNQESLGLVGDRFIDENPDISPLRFGQAASLGRIVCRIPIKRQKKLVMGNRAVFFSIVPILGATIEDDYCIRHMAEFAKEVYGPPHRWTAEDVSSLGVIMAGLSKEDWQTNGPQPEALSGLSPAAVSHISPEILKVLSEEQLSRLSSLSVAAISHEQSSGLSPSQSAVLERVRRQIPDRNLRASPLSSGSSHISSNWISITALLGICLHAFT